MIVLCLCQRMVLFQGVLGEYLDVRCHDVCNLSLPLTLITQRKRERQQLSNVNNWRTGVNTGAHCTILLIFAKTGNLLNKMLEKKPTSPLPIPALKSAHTGAPGWLSGLSV